MDAAPANTQSCVVSKRGFDDGRQPQQETRCQMLRRADLQRGFEMLHAVADQAGSGDAFARAGVRCLPALVGSELTTLSICHLDSGRREVVGFPDARLGEADRACFDRFFSEHPLVRYHAHLGGRGAHRVSDSVPFARFRHSALYSEYYRRIGIDHVVAVPIKVNRRVLVSFVLNRCGRDFSDDDCALLDQVGPVLARLYAALESEGRQPPPTGGDPLGTLTPRERDVHDWLARGKTDRDIAAILGCSHRTVQKHLQRIYEKLGVETRTAAVLRAFERSRR
jgi:DNA-binding CsgD family transcriptional regulator